MVLCERCGQSIDLENSDCAIHPEEHDYAIKAQLTARETRASLLKLVLERREQERRT